jgi:hypothetical protein
LGCSDKFVLGWFFYLKLGSVATVIPNHPQSSRIIVFHRKLSPNVPNLTEKKKVHKEKNAEKVDLFGN